MAYPLMAALQAAGVLDNLGSFIDKYFERGAIRPLIVTAKGMPSKEERERMESWFARTMSGIRNAFKVKIFYAETMNFDQIGDGLDQLHDQTLTADQRQDLALALGIPTSILFAGASNYATALQEHRGFYDNTILPRVEFIASTLNEQLLDPQGLHMEFHPEELDLYQEDESQRSGALSQLTAAGVPLLTAMEILGYDLTDEQREAIEEATEEPEEEPEPETVGMETIDIASELAMELDGTAPEDFQVSFADVFDEFKKGVAEQVDATDYDTHYNLGTSRCVFVIDPNQIVRAMIYYPLTTGRNMDEILRLIDALQTTDKHGVATPANWRPGDQVIVCPPKTIEAAAERVTTPGIVCTELVLREKGPSEIVGTERSVFPRLLKKVQMQGG